MKKILVLLSFFAAACNVTAKNDVKVSYISLESTEISANPIKIYQQPTKFEETKNTLRLYPEVKYQTMSGIGGCFNEIGGEALLSLSEADQKEVLNALFGGNGGSEFAYCRASIGASDFGIDAYSFSEIADDYNMEHFSLEREKRYMLPYMQKAFAINPKLRLFGSPWSPPAWMKPSGYMDRGVEFPEKNILKDDPKVYAAYALYFKKYVEEYAKAGVPVERILIQNEQDLHTKYPSCRIPVEQMAKFVQSYLRPLFDKENIKTEIWAGTFRTAKELEGVRFAASKEFKKGFDGIGVQYSAKQHLTDIRELAPELPMMHTEGNCHDGSNTLKQAASRFGEIADYINSGSENYAYWNMILNETGLSGWDWRQNALITINRDTKEVTYNPDYAAISLISRFVRPNSVRIASHSNRTLMSFENEDTYHVIMQNDSDKTLTYQCIIGEKSMNVEIPAKSLCGIEISK